MNKHKKISLACFLLSISLFSAMITSCAAKKDSNDQTEASAVPDASESAAETTLSIEEKLAASALEAVDYEGDTVTVIAPDAIGQNYPFCEIYAEGETGETINDAVYARNGCISDKYNIQLSVVRVNSPAESYDKYLKKAVMSGDGSYDFALTAPVTAFGAALNEHLRVLDELPHIDKDASWWCDYFNEASSVRGINYFLSGDIDIGLFAASGMVYFNKTVRESCGIENLYALVEGGSFTIDKFDELCRQVTSDLNGDGTIGSEDLIGLRGNTYSFQMFLYGLGDSVVKKDGDDLLSLNFSENVISRITRVIELMNDEPYVQQPNLEEVGFPAFKNDLALFLVQPAYQFSVLRDMQSDYGLLPMPKYDETQEEYYAQIHTGWSSTVVVPVTLSDSRADEIGRVIEDMAYSSSVYVRPAFYETMLLGKYTRDNESEGMLDYIFGNIVVDPIYLMTNIGVDFDTKTREMSGSGNTNVVSFLESKRESYQKVIDKVNEEWVAPEN